jgi:membrane protease YdiL (CAAX protease family)
LHDTKVALFAQMPPLQLMAALASAQAVVILLVLLAAGLFQGRPAKVLALKTVPSATTLGRAFALMALLLAPYNLAVYLLSPESLLADLKLFAELMRSEAAWLVVIVVSLGAPFSEELLFRGFLQPALAQSRIGYFGASLVTTMGWTALHAGYTPAGLIEVFLIGLFFSWLLWHTGSLWAAILCHAAYNTLLLAIIALVSLPA